MSMRHNTLKVTLGLAGTMALIGAAAGQGNPFIPRGGMPPAAAYYPGGYNPGRVGGALQGQAAVISATGELNVMNEQARVEREKANQAKLDTKKKTFEEMMYEKANTATYTEETKYTKDLSLERMMQSPTPAEITSGKTLNAMLPMVKTLAARGTQGPAMPIDQEQLRHINVTVGKDGVNLGMLTDGGAHLDWPLCLQGAKQKKVASQIPVAVAQVRSGNLDAKLYREITTELSQLSDDLTKQFRTEQIDGGEYLEGKRFLEPLTQSVQALRQSTSSRFLDGSYAAKGRTVPELVDHMTRNGLIFAACNPGDEATYYAFHDQFVAYTASAQAAGGYHVKYNPPRTDPWKVGK